MSKITNDYSKLQKNKSGDFRGKNTVPYHRTMDKNPRWRGGEFDRGDGYIIVRIGSFEKNKKGSRYRLKHRIVMESFLKRKLERNEIVHHINGDKSDNRIENLEILNQKEHAKKHDVERVKNNKGQYV